MPKAGPAPCRSRRCPTPWRRRKLCRRPRRDREYLLGRGTVVLVAGVEAFDAVVFHVDAVDPVVGGDPEDALRLLDDVADDVVRNRIRIVRRELVSPEAVTVVGIQAVPCPEPHHQGRILIDAVDRTVRQPVRAGQRIVLEGGHGGRHGNPNRRQQQENQLFRHNASHVVTKICFYPEPQNHAAGRFPKKAGSRGGSSAPPQNGKAMAGRALP